MDRQLAFEAARQRFATGDDTAAVRHLAETFGALHPEAGTLRAIQAVLDQLDNPSALQKNKDAYEKHGVSQNTFSKWKKKLAAFVVEEEAATVAVDADLCAALEHRDARLPEPQVQDGQTVRLSRQFLAGTAPEHATSSDVLVDAAAASGVSLAEALDKLILSAADQHAAAIVAIDQAEAEAVRREREAADAAREAADAARDAADAARVAAGAARAAEAAKERARQAAALADSARERVAAAHVAAEAAAREAAREAAVRNDAREAEALQRAEAAASAAGSSSGDAPPAARADGASPSAAGQALAAGQRVCIHGVETRTELNGTYGRTIAFHAERGRYAVELEGSHWHVQTGRGMAGSGGRPDEQQEATAAGCTLASALSSPVS